VAHRKRIGSSVAAKTRFEARTDRSPIELRKPPNQAYFTLQQRHGKQPEEGRLVKSRLFASRAIRNPLEPIPSGAAL
jgi:hypothetical protein